MRAEVGVEAVKGRHIGSDGHQRGSNAGHAQGGQRRTRTGGADTETPVAAAADLDGETACGDGEPGEHKPPMSEIGDKGGEADARDETDSPSRENHSEGLALTPFLGDLAR